MIYNQIKNLKLAIMRNIKLIVFEKVQLMAKSKQQDNY